MTREVDCISRQATINAIKRIHPVDTDYDCTLYDKVDVMYVLDEMPSVTPQEPKTGHWILTDVESSKVWHCNCSKCNKDPLDFVGGSENWWLIKTKLPKFCPYCGCKMVEPQESEET